MEWRWPGISSTNSRRPGCGVRAGRAGCRRDRDPYRCCERGHLDGGQQTRDRRRRGGYDTERGATRPGERRSHPGCPGRRTGSCGVWKSHRSPLHDALLVANHRVRGTEAIITNDAEFAGETTVWRRLVGKSRSGTTGDRSGASVGSPNPPPMYRDAVHPTCPAPSTSSAESPTIAYSLAGSQRSANKYGAGSGLCARTASEEAGNLRADVPIAVFQLEVSRPRNRIATSGYEHPND